MGLDSWRGSAFGCLLIVNSGRASRIFQRLLRIVCPEPSRQEARKRASAGMPLPARKNSRLEQTAFEGLVALTRRAQLLAEGCATFFAVAANDFLSIDLPDLSNSFPPGPGSTLAQRFQNKFPPRTLRNQVAAGIKGGSPTWGIIR